MNEYRERKGEKFTLMYRCGKHVNNSGARPSANCPICSASEKVASGKISKSLARKVEKKKRKEK